MSCPCGYDLECAVWCGQGHETGQCPAPMLDHFEFRFPEHMQAARIEILIPDFDTCGPYMRYEFHPRLEVVRCANCKEHLLW